MRSDFYSQIKQLEDSLEYERKRTELLQSRLDKVLRLTDTQPNSNLSANQDHVPVRSSVSPIKQRHIAEVESRERYWKNKIKEIEEQGKEVVSSSNSSNNIDS